MVNRERINDSAVSTMSHFLYRSVSLNTFSVKAIFGPSRQDFHCKKNRYLRFHSLRMLSYFTKNAKNLAREFSFLEDAVKGQTQPGCAN